MVTTKRLNNSFQNNISIYILHSNPMENFYNWMSKPLPNTEVEVWFQVHNMISEKVFLFGDIFLSLSTTIHSTWLGDDQGETKISLSKQDIENHFVWCWKQTIKNFELENIKIKLEGEHKEYLKTFFEDSFYNQEEYNIRDAIPKFIDELFNLEKPFAKSDLDILTEVYKVLNKNVNHISNGIDDKPVGIIIN